MIDEGKVAQNRSDIDFLIWRTVIARDWRCGPADFQWSIYCFRGADAKGDTRPGRWTHHCWAVALDRP